MYHNQLSVTVVKRKPKVKVGAFSGRELKTAKQLLAEDPITGHLKRELDNIEKTFQEQQKRNKKNKTKSKE